MSGKSEEIVAKIARTSSFMEQKTVYLAKSHGDRGSKQAGGRGNSARSRPSLRYGKVIA
jgi:hypothetical protein